MNIYSVADNIISPLGFDTSANLQALIDEHSGIDLLRNLGKDPVHGAAISRDEVDQRFDFANPKEYSFLEKLMILSIRDVLHPIQEKIEFNRLLLIVSSTKGNIDLLKNGDNTAAYLPALASKINRFFKLPNEPVVISNACISGSSGIITGKKLIQAGEYDHVLICGGDILSEFTVSGFQCLKAISDEPCKPYDKSRTGITLGEGSGTILISNNPDLCENKLSFAEITGAGQANDANHISGPSRTARGLKIAIEKALKQSNLTKSQIGYINAHGTATLYNDEMESIAFADLDLADIPINSLKGYFGHTLGAAGVIESIITIWQMNSDKLVASPGYSEQGTTHKLNIVTTAQEASINYAMKTISGFGGCNAAIIFKNGTRNHSI